MRGGLHCYQGPRGPSEDELLLEAVAHRAAQQPRPQLKIPATAERPHSIVYDCAGCGQPVEVTSIALDAVERFNREQMRRGKPPIEPPPCPDCKAAADRRATEQRCKLEAEGKLAKHQLLTRRLPDLAERELWAAVKRWGGAAMVAAVEKARRKERDAV